MNISELDKHMQSFNDLGFKNQFVYDWHKEILSALEKTNINMSIYYSTLMDNKQLLQHIVSMGNTYNYLNSIGLVNKGRCPITGETINNTISYEMYGRKIYLSPEGMKKCQELDRTEWGITQQEFDKFQQQKRDINRKSNRQINIISFVSLALSIIISWQIVSPKGFLSYLYFLLLGVIVYKILKWLVGIIFFRGL